MEVEQQNIKHENSESLNKINQQNTNLNTINNIYFTNREIDVIACVLGGKTVKKAASMLTISPNTVAIHIRNITAKLGCNSQNGVIDFIEKSDKLVVIRKYYDELVNNNNFELELKKFSSLEKKTNVNCILFYYKDQRTKPSIILQIEKHLTLAGITVTSKVWEKGQANSYIINNMGNNQIDYVIYAISAEFSERLQAINYDLAQEATNIEPLTKAKTNSVIFLLLDNPFAPELQKQLTGLQQLTLTTQEEYYFFIFDLLKMLLSNHNIYSNVNAFAKQYKKLHNIVSSQTLTKADKLEANANNRLHFKAIRKHFSWKWLIFIISPICFSFVIYNINKNISCLFDKSCTLEARTTNINEKSKFSQSKQQTTRFNLPPRNSNFTGRQDILVQIEQQLDSQKLGIITQTIAGLGGIGKTSLATEFAYLAAEKNHYTAVLWFTAETPHTINDTYRTLADFFQIDIRGLDPNATQNLIHQQLIKYYKGSKVLLILDNVPNYKNIQEYIQKLHKELFPSLGLNILITSRSQHWPESPLILDTFTKIEALEFIRKQLPNEDKKSIIKLAKSLYYFPLALGQATAYIREHTNINDYLKLYTSKQQEYLDKFSGDKNQYSETLWRTWNIALDKLSIHAKKMIFISSYLYPDDIPIEFFANLTVEERANAIEDLRKYSFITLIKNNKSFKIHRLLQKIIRVNIDYEVKNSIFQPKFYDLATTIKLLENKFDFNYVKYKDWSLCENYLTHAQTLAEHAIHAKKEFIDRGLQLYAQVAMHLIYAQENFKDAFKILKNMLPLIKRHYAHDKSLKFLLANVNTHISFIKYQLGDIGKATKYIKEAVLTYSTEKTRISKPIENLLNSLRVVNNVSLDDNWKQYDLSFAMLVYGLIKQDEGDFTYSRYYYERALKAFDGLKTTELMMTYKVSILHNLGNLHMYGGSIDKATQILTSAKLIADKHFDGHTMQAYVYERLACLLYYIGQYNAARDHIEKCLKIRAALLAKDHLRIGDVREILGVILSNDNRSESLVNLKEAEVIYRKNLKTDHHDFISLHIYRHYVSEMLQQYDEALRYLIKAQVIARKYWGDGPYVALLHQFSPIDIFPSIDNNEKNLKYYLHATKLIKKLFGPKHIRTARYYYLLGQVYENMHNKIKATKYYQLALDIANKQRFDNETLIEGNKNNIAIIQERLRSLSFHSM